MMSDNRHETFSADILTALTEEQLKEILAMELMSEETDVDLIKRVNAALEAKSKKQTDCDVDEKWREFVADYAGTEPLYDLGKTVSVDQASKTTAPRRLRVPFIAKIAAILVIVFMLGTVTAYAFGYDVFGAIATWTKETFSFTQQTGQMPQTSVLPSRSTKTSDLQAALDEHGITEKLAPTYLPEGYEQVEFYAENMDDTVFFAAVYERSDNRIAIRIRQHLSSKNTADHEKDGTEPEIYEVNGISHYFMSNMGIHRAVWANGFFEGSISGLKTKSELKKMIDSIYEE